MENKIQIWHNEIDNNTSQFEDKFNNLTSEQLNWKPNSNSWSIGQVIEHLKISSEGYFKIPKIIRGKDFKLSILSKISFMPKLYGNLILKYVDPDTKRKVKTMKVFEPTQSNINSNILDDFKTSQQDLHKFIDDNIELITNRTIIPSPVSRHILYHFDTVVDILVTHQKRHFNQACNVLEMMNKNNK